MQAKRPANKQVTAKTQSMPFKRSNNSEHFVYTVITTTTITTANNNRRNNNIWQKGSLSYLQHAPKNMGRYKFYLSLTFRHDSKSNSNSNCDCDCDGDGDLECDSCVLANKFVERSVNYMPNRQDGTKESVVGLRRGCLARSKHSGVQIGAAYWVYCPQRTQAQTR